MKGEEWEKKRKYNIWILNFYFFFFFLTYSSFPLSLFLSFITHQLIFVSFFYNLKQNIMKNLRLWLILIINVTQLDLIIEKKY